MKLLTVFVVATALLCVAEAANWAVLVAGSSGYYNYRHQSDVCHAFQILTDPVKGKFPKENVIVFMMDDIANSPSNPTKGMLINHPSGADVYHGVNKDYTGAQVTPQNFLNVITGNKQAMKGIGSGKVLESTAEDNVFIYFADHGAPGFICFPSAYLYANQLMPALQKMFTNKMYNKLVFYIEACESGSMFQNLPKNINIYATTAATGSQSSYACYYDQKRGTYLGDEYSVRWMEDSDGHDFFNSEWTLKQQFTKLQQQVKQSQPQQFGDLSISSLQVEDFQGFNFETTKKTNSSGTTIPFLACNGASSRDIVLETLYRRLEHSTSNVDMLLPQIREEHSAREATDTLFRNLLSKVVGETSVDRVLGTRYEKISNFDCLQDYVETFTAQCGRLSDYGLKYAYTFVNMCEEMYPSSKVHNAILSVCA